MPTAYLGPEYSNEAIKSVLQRFGLENGRGYVYYKDKNELVKNAIKILLQNKMLAWYQGKMEFGPRALGARSLLFPLDDPTSNELSNKTKRREPWRPSAMSITDEGASKILDNAGDFPFMTIECNVRDAFRRRIVSGIHMARENNSTRPQILKEVDNPLYYMLLKLIGGSTGIPGVLNTSFNIDEPIVESPEEAINTLLYLGIKQLVIGNYIVDISGLEENVFPSVISAKEEPFLSDIFKTAFASDRRTNWEDFFDRLKSLVNRRTELTSIDNYHYVIIENDNKQIKIPLVKELFSKQYRTKLALAYLDYADINIEYTENVKIYGSRGKYENIVSFHFEEGLKLESILRQSKPFLSNNGHHRSTSNSL